MLGQARAGLYISSEVPLGQTGWTTYPFPRTTTEICQQPFRYNMAAGRIGVALAARRNLDTRWMTWLEGCYGYQAVFYGAYVC